MGSLLAGLGTKLGLSIPEGSQEPSDGWRRTAAAITRPLTMLVVLCLEHHSLRQLMGKLPLCGRVVCMEGANHRETGGRAWLALLGEGPRVLRGP